MPSWSRVFSSSAVMTGIRLAGAGAGFVTQLALARLLSAHDLGVFFATTSMAVIVGLVAAQGYPGVAVRFIARYRERGRPALLAAFIAQAQRETAGWALAAAALVATAALLWPECEPGVRVAVAASAGSILAVAAFNIYPAFANAMRQFALCYIPEGIARPVAFLGAVAALALARIEVSLGLVAIVFALVTAAVAAVQYGLLRRSLPRGPARASPALKRRWRSEARPLVMVALFTNFFADLGVLLATPFLSGADIAAFGVSLKLAMLVGYAVQVAQHMALPDLADAHERGDAAALRRSLLNASLFPAALTLAATWGDRILSVFGPDFARAQLPLTLLIGAQFFRAVAGPSVTLLILHGAQRTNALICAGSCLALLVGNAAFIPSLGLPGAALAVVATYMVWIAVTAVMLHRRGNIRADLPALLRPALLSRMGAKPAAEPRLAQSRG